MTDKRQEPVVCMPRYTPKFQDFAMQCLTCHPDPFTRI